MKYEWPILAGSVAVLMSVNVKTKFDDSIRTISGMHGNNWHLVKAIIKVESNFDPNAHRKTDTEDSRGLGQINAGTARALGVSDLNQLFDPEYNIEVMNRLLSDLRKRHSGLDLISAYNAGRPIKDEKNQYINSPYVLNVYARFLAYSILDI